MLELHSLRLDYPVMRMPFRSRYVREDEEVVVLLDVT